MIRHQKIEKPGDITVIISLHSVSEIDFEIDDIEFADAEYDQLIKDYGRLNGKPDYEEKLKKICDRLCYLDNIREEASEDVGCYGSVSKNINRELWQKNRAERIYGIKITLWYTTTQDYFGEVDIDVDFEYEVIFEMSERGKILYDVLENDELEKYIGGNVL